MNKLREELINLLWVDLDITTYGRDAYIDEDSAKEMSNMILDLFKSYINSCKPEEKKPGWKHCGECGGTLYNQAIDVFYTKLMEGIG